MALAHLTDSQADNLDRQRCPKDQDLKTGTRLQGAERASRWARKTIPYTAFTETTDDTEELFTLFSISDLSDGNGPICVEKIIVDVTVASDLSNAVTIDVGITGNADYFIADVDAKTEAKTGNEEADYEATFDADPFVTSDIICGFTPSGGEDLVNDPGAGSVTFYCLYSQVPASDTFRY